MKKYIPIKMIRAGRYKVCFDGLALCFILAILLMLYSAVALVQDKRLFGSAPKDIVDAIHPKEERFKGARFLGWILVILSMFILVAVAVIGIWDGVRQGYGFGQFFCRCLAILYIYKAFDLVFLDWVLQKTRFFQRYYPETEGCEGYHSYGFNMKSQIAKIILFPFISALIAWLCTFI
ncbi:MAG: hypothetical protein II859_06295 [Bacteroidales bacterium]|nr:hypothetical protein [Bacteroidales bacterium]